MFRFANAFYRVTNMVARYMPSSCVCLSVSHSGIVSKWLNITLRNQSRTIGQNFIFYAKDHGEIRTG